MFLLVLWTTFWKGSVNMKTLAILLGEHPCIVNILFGPMTVHYSEVLLYKVMMHVQWFYPVPPNARGPSNRRRGRVVTA